MIIISKERGEDVSRAHLALDSDCSEGTECNTLETFGYPSPIELAWLKGEYDDMMYLEGAPATEEQDIEGVSVHFACPCSLDGVHFKGVFGCASVSPIMCDMEIL